MSFLVETGVIGVGVLPPDVPVWCEAVLNLLQILFAGWILFVLLVERPALPPSVSLMHVLNSRALSNLLGFCYLLQFVKMFLYLLG